MQFDQLKRREFVTLGGAASWPFAAGAQEGERVRRIWRAPSQPGRRRSGVSGPLGSFRTSIARFGLGRGSERAVGRPPPEAYGCGYSQTRRRIGRRGARRYSHKRRHNLAAIATDNPHYTDSFRVGDRSSRCWFCSAPFSSRGQRHWLYAV